MKGNFYKRRSLWWVGFILAIALLGFIPLRIAVAFHQAPTPQAIFVLGGDSSRMKFSGEFWKSHSNLDIWVSDYHQNLDFNRRIFHKFGVPDERLHFDFEATDTVTNFTTLAPIFEKKGLRHLYLVTSNYHMRRSRVIATIVLGSRGIIVTLIAVPSKRASETLFRALRDGGRSVVWLLTGKTGASLKGRL